MLAPLRFPTALQLQVELFERPALCVVLILQRPHQPRGGAASPTSGRNGAIPVQALLAAAPDLEETELEALAAAAPGLRSGSLAELLAAVPGSAGRGVQTNARSGPQTRTFAAA